MNSPVARSSIWPRSMALALNCQSKSASVLRFAEAGLADAMGDAPLAALGGLLADQQVQEVQVRQALPLGARQGGVERLGRQRHLERGEVRKDLLAQGGGFRRGIFDFGRLIGVRAREASSRLIAPTWGAAGRLGVLRAVASGRAFVLGQGPRTLFGRAWAARMRSTADAVNSAVAGRAVQARPASRARA